MWAGFKRPTASSQSTQHIAALQKNIRETARSNEINELISLHRTNLRNLITPSFFSLIALCAGIAIGYGSALAITSDTYLGLALVIVLLAALALYRHMQTKDFSIVRHVLIPLALGATVLARVIHLPAGDFPHDPARIYCIADIQERHYDTHLTLIPDGSLQIAASRQALGIIRRPGELAPGDRVRISALPRAIQRQNGPTDGWAVDRLRKGVSAVFYLDEKTISVVEKTSPSLRRGVRKRIEEALDRLYRPETARMIEALYFGNQHVITKRVQDEFRRAGVLHILAASGMNVGLIALIPLAFFGALRTDRKAAMAATLVAVSGYLALTDVPVSLFRAYVMFAIYTIQKLFDLDRNIINTLLWSAVVILIVAPWELYGLGFQLSFGATLGILLFARPLSTAFRALPGPIASSLSVTCAAQIPVYPILLLQVHELNLVGIITNLIAVPGMSVMLIGSIAVTALSALSPPLAHLLAPAIERLFDCNHQFIRTCAHIPGHFIINEPAPLLLIPYVFLVLTLAPIRRFWIVAPSSLALAYVGAWLYCASVQPPTGPSLSVLKNTHSQAVVFTGPRVAVVAGHLGSFEDARAVDAALTASQPSETHIAITKADYASVRYFVHIIKRQKIASVHVSDDFRINVAFRRLCHALDADRVPLKIIPSRSGSGARPETARDRLFASSSSVPPIDLVLALDSHLARIGALAFATMISAGPDAPRCSILNQQ